MIAVLENECPGIRRTLPTANRMPKPELLRLPNSQPVSYHGSQSSRPTPRQSVFKVNVTAVKVISVSWQYKLKSINKDHLCFCSDDVTLLKLLVVKHAGDVDYNDRLRQR